MMTTTKYWLLWLPLIIGALHFAITSAEMSAGTKSEVNSGINVFLKVVDAMEEKGAEKSLIKTIGALGPYFGVAGGVISFILIFLPQQDSAELKFMKKAFTEVNTKLDKITTKLDHIERFLINEIQRAAYLESAMKITYGFKKLHEYFDEVEKTKCSDRKHCDRVRGNILTRYIKFFDIQFHLYKILTGAMSKGPFNEPLLDLLTKRYQCDVGKLDTFTNGLVKLAFQAQMVILTHEKVTGSNISVVNSVKTWLKTVYDLRDYTNKLKNACYGDITRHMLNNIKDTKYQNYNDNEGANDAMRRDMRDKYDWLDWNVYSYQAYGKDHHYMINTASSFWNSPKSSDARKRNIITTFIDKSGTYKNQGYLVWNAIQTIAEHKVCGFNCNRDMEMLLNMIVEELKMKNMWKYVLSLNVLNDPINADVLAENRLTYIYQIVTFKHKTQDSQSERALKFSVRVLLTLNSLERAAYASPRECHGHGKSITLPYSAKTECQCNPNFDGEDCKEHSKNGIASTIDALISATIHLPTLVDIYYDLDDLKDEVNIGFGHIEAAINQLHTTLVKAYKDFGRAMSQQFAWVNLQIIYSQSIQQINYYSSRFQNLQNSIDVETEGKHLAEVVLSPEGVQKWLYNLNELFMGNLISPIGAHRPFMMMFMDNNIKQACTKQYKSDVDSVYRQFVILQQKGYIIWAQALEIEEIESGIIEETYKRRLDKQNANLTSLTCQYSIPSSVNIQCTGGRYIHRKMVLTNKCARNYYITGQAKTTCVNKTSLCEPCHCYTNGSEGKECQDKTGKCICKPGYYGDKCENRDCVWTTWTGYSSCSKSCDYGGTQYQTRSYKVTKVGHGKICPGNNRETRPCFHSCCTNQFHCTNKRKCIRSSYKCDYDNDCGDKQDESSCQETCSIYYTSWSSAGGGKVYYLDRHNVDCGGQQYVLQMFNLERSGGSIRYKYRCCRLNKDIAAYHRVSTRWTPDGPSSVYLDRQYVSCASNSYINGFRLEDGSVNMRYNYYCNKLKSSAHKSRQSCFSTTTSSTYVNEDGDNYYLDRQTVDCGDRYMINSFHLRRTSSRYWLYEFTCCRILA